MTKQEVGSLAFKVAGIYVLVHAVASLFTTGFLFTAGVQRELGLTNLDWRIVVALGSAPTMAMLALGTILILYSARFAAWTFAHPDAPATATATMTADELQATLLSVIGISMIASTLPHFARFATYVASPPGSVERSMHALLGQLGPEMAQRCTAILIGVGLIVGRNGATAGWIKLRRVWLTLRGREGIAGHGGE